VRRKHEATESMLPVSHVFFTGTDPGIELSKERAGMEIFVVTGV
jgi:hypothetical protein